MIARVNPEAGSRYMLTADEFLSWQSSIDQHDPRDELDPLDLLNAPIRGLELSGRFRLTEDEPDPHLRRFNAALTTSSSSD